MSILLDFTVGVIRGMGGPDLKDWVSNLPGKLGQEIGAIVKRNLDPDGRLTARGAEQVREVLDQAPEQLGNVVASLLRSVPEGTSDSLIGPYLDVLNFVVAALRRLGRLLVLRGFLHRPDCISYWHFGQRDSDQISDFRKHPNLDLIMSPLSPRVYVLDEAPTDERVKELNLCIRTNPSHTLEYPTYSGGFEVETVAEFEIHGPLGRKEAIPIGAPGIPAMVASLEVAVAAQRAPFEQVRATIDSIRDRRTEKT
jgi:hypothetical protein